MRHALIRRSALCCLASIAMLCFMSLNAQAQEIKDRTLKFAMSLAKDHPMGLGAQKFADLVSQRSGGKIKITVYPSCRTGRRSSEPCSCARRHPGFHHNGDRASFRAEQGVHDLRLSISIQRFSGSLHAE